MATDRNNGTKSVVPTQMVQDCSNIEICNFCNNCEEDCTCFQDYEYTVPCEEEEKEVKCPFCKESEEDCWCVKKCGGCREEVCCCNEYRGYCYECGEDCTCGKNDEHNLIADASLCPNCNSDDCCCDQYDEYGYCRFCDEKDCCCAVMEKNIRIIKDSKECFYNEYGFFTEEVEVPRFQKVDYSIDPKRKEKVTPRFEAPSPMEIPYSQPHGRCKIFGCMRLANYACQSCDNTVCKECCISHFQATLGSIVNASSTKCPLCRQTFGYINLVQINPIIPTNSEMQVGWWYGLCTQCGDIKKHSEQACREEKPEIDDFVCHDCFFPRGIPPLAHECAICIVEQTARRERIEAERIERERERERVRIEWEAGKRKARGGNS